MLCHSHQGLPLHRMHPTASPGRFSATSAAIVFSAAKTVSFADTIWRFSLRIRTMFGMASIACLSRGTPSTNAALRVKSHARVSTRRGKIGRSLRRGRNRDWGMRSRVYSCGFCHCHSVRM